MKIATTFYFVSLLCGTPLDFFFLYRCGLPDLFARLICRESVPAAVSRPKQKDEKELGAHLDRAREAVLGCMRRSIIPSRKLRKKGLEEEAWDILRLLSGGICCCGNSRKKWSKSRNGDGEPPVI